MLKDELDFFIKNQKKLLKKYKNKFLVIKDQKIIDVYDNPLEAYLNTQKEYELGTFIIQRCIPGKKAYTVSIQSCVVVA